MKWITRSALVGAALGLGVAATPATGHAATLLSEVFYDAVGSDDGEGFVEIAAAPGTVLDGLAIEAINGADGSVTHNIALQGTVGASGLFVVADATSGGTTSVVGADQLANFDFQNGPDSVVLLDGSGSALDAVGYGTFGAGTFFAGEGSPTVDPSAGESIQRRFADLDTQDNAVDWIAGAPTPGTAARVPEPASALLLATGLIGLAAGGRWRRSRPRPRPRGA